VRLRCRSSRFCTLVEHVNSVRDSPTGVNHEPIRVDSTLCAGANNQWRLATGCVLRWLAPCDPCTQLGPMFGGHVNRGYTQSMYDALEMKRAAECELRDVRAFLTTATPWLHKQEREMLLNFIDRLRRGRVLSERQRECMASFRNRVEWRKCPKFYRG